MQTVKKLQSEIDFLLIKGDALRKTVGTQDKEYRDAQRQIKFLKECLAYLQSEPTEEFIIKQKEALSQKLINRINGYEAWRKNQQTTKKKTDQQWQSQYNSEMGTSHIRSQNKKH